MPDAAENNLQAVIDAARDGARPVQIEPEALYVIPNANGSAKVVSESLEKYSETPQRKRGDYWPQTVESFISYVEAHAEDGTSIWVTPNDGHIEAVLNDHTGTPGWGDHRAILDLLVSPEWTFWLAKDGQLIPQLSFANHIEEGLADVISPDGAEMLEIAQKIEGTNSVAFKSNIDLTSGEVRVGYEEKTDAKATGAQGGMLAIPKTFDLAIAPFVGEEAYRLTARLRYRVNGGDLHLGYKIDRPEAAVREVLKGIADTLSEKFPDIVYFGLTPSGERLASE